MFADGLQFVSFPSDITTASVAKGALEGHCIYDGGYCKLHLTYSRHTDLNVKVYICAFESITKKVAIHESEK